MSPLRTQGSRPGARGARDHRESEVEELRARIAHLEEGLKGFEEELRSREEQLLRRGAILMNMTDTAPDAGGGPQEPSERPDSEAPRQVPWWRRMFGGA
jgi:hypothetical protein